MTGKSIRYGFTLIELLIVVAIIGVLAAIAIPNFLQAQTRAKMSACMSQMRTLATAVETYCVDYTLYPPYGRITPADVVEYPATQNAMTDRMSFIGTVITTPIPYITRIPLDPFAGGFAGPPQIVDIEYLNLVQHVANFGSSPPLFAAQLIPAWGPWRMVGAGPDADRGMDIKTNIVYDPSNGTVSNGDIVRCWKYPESRMNPNAP